MESSRTSADQLAEIDLTATDYVAFLLVAILAINAVWRFSRPQVNNAGLLRVNLAMILVILCSVSVVYEFIDPMLGGRSYLNLTSHLLMLYSGWQITVSLTAILEDMEGINTPRISTHPVTLIASCLLVVGSFFVLSPTSSRGLDSYDHHLAFVVYWVGTLIPLILGAFQVIPRMVNLAPLIFKAQCSTRATLCLLWLSYAGIILSATSYGITAAFQGFWVIREAIVSVTTLLFAVSLLMATAALPQPRGRKLQHQLQKVNRI